MKDKYLELLSRQLLEIEKYKPVMSKSNPAVSKASVGWHLSHSLKVIINVVGELETSKPERFVKQFNFKRILVMTTGKIPRGIAKSPRRVLPDDDLEPETVEKQIGETEKKIGKINSLPKNAFFQHPFFHQMNRDQTKKFLTIHTEHHLKIVRDILKSSN